MARIQCEYCPITFARPYGASRHIRQYYDAHFVPHNPSEHACQLPANQDCRRRLGGDIVGTRCMRTSGDVIEVKASQKTPQTMILSPVIRQLMSQVLLTLRKMSLKSNKTSQASKMSLNTSPTSKIQKYQKFKNFPHGGDSSTRNF